MRVYFNDMTRFFRWLDKPEFESLKIKIKLFELVPDDLNVEHEANDKIAASKIKVKMVVREPKFPYKVFVSQNDHVWSMLDKNLIDAIKSQIVGQCTNHKYVEDIFEDVKLRYRSQYEYFYCDNVDWLSAVCLIQPNIISRIYEFQQAKTNEQ